MNTVPCTCNPFEAIGNQWMLICAGSDRAEANMMTASWGGLGVLWSKNVAYTFIRPQRHTRTLTDTHDTYALCFFGEEYRDALNLCGKASGRDTDKIAATGLTPLFKHGTVYFAEAERVFFCKKLYAQDLDPACFTDPALCARNYPENDYHRVYVGEIIDYIEK